MVSSFKLKIFAFFDSSVLLWVLFLQFLIKGKMEFLWRIILQSFRVLPPLVTEFLLPKLFVVSKIFDERSAYWGINFSFFRISLSSKMFSLLSFCIFEPRAFRWDFLYDLKVQALLSFRLVSHWTLERFD